MARARAATSKTASPADEQLARYRSMRNFHITQEPRGKNANGASRGTAEKLPFVIQKHAASHLHYDFRLGWNGVLKSWAIAKGPSYFPGDKRLAVQVEDHPLEYGGFEGIIPKGQYGGGTVMLWDRGTWEPHVDVNEGLKKGSLKFTMYGEKMQGKWALVRMGGRAANPAKPNWLLIKEHDEDERAQSDLPITEEAPNSVATGRDLDAIARAEDRIWQSNREQAGPAQPAKNGTSHRKSSKSDIETSVAPDWSKLLADAPREALPKFVAPQRASLAKDPPSGDRWIHEIKLDGYRMQARLEGKKSNVRLLTRKGLDWTHRMPSIADALKHLPVTSAILDGEVVVLKPDGTSSFAELQAAFQEGSKHELTYFVFDLLHLEGRNLRGMPLVKRKQILEKLLSSGPADSVLRLSEHLTGNAREIFEKACALKTEGIISKFAESAYQDGRSKTWQKIKCYTEQEFIVAGFTLPTNGIRGVGALLLGYYQNGKLTYAGRTGTGFTQKTHRLLRDKLDKISIAKPAFAKLPPGASKDAHWVKPELVAQVSFSNWTADDLVRQASFKGLREDKPAKEVRREESLMHEEAPTKKAKSTAAHRASSSKRVVAKTRDASAPGIKTGERATEDLPIRLTHPNKVLDAGTGVTKEALARYYAAIAPHMLPHIAHRPLTLVRCVDGSGKPCFYQKHKNEMLSGGFGSVDVVNRKTGAHEPYITLSTSEAVVELAQIGVLEVHPWGSRNETLEQPDRIIIDLDPDPSVDWKIVADSAKEVRRRLRALHLRSFVKTTGGKGLHVVVPIVPEHHWPEVKDFAHSFVLLMEKDDPKRFLTKMSKAARVGKIFLDYLRNDRGATAVAPFSPRSRVGLPVSMPLSWSELDGERPAQFLVSDFASWKKRLSRDPWKDILSVKQRVTLA